MQISQRLIGLILATFGMGGLGWLWWSQTHAEETDAREACQVLSVYDGDTIACDLNRDGEIQKPEEQIRMIGIDTPEMHYSRKNKTYHSPHPTDEPYAPEASALTEALVDKERVYLAYDVERHDPYGRTLAYVYFTSDGNETVGEELLKKGFARVLFIGQNRKLSQAYYAAEDKARREGRGLWQPEP